MLLTVFFGNEISSEKLRKEIGLKIGPNIGSGSKLTQYLQSKHGIKVKIVTIDQDEKIVKRYDEKSKKWRSEKTICTDDES